MKNKELILIYLSEFTNRFCVWALLSQLLVHLIKNNWMSGPEQLYIIGASLSLLYFSPLFGGLIKDWLFNEKQAVVLGIGLISTGNLILLFAPQAFYTGLGFVLLGSGLVTPNTPLLLSTMTSLTENNRTKLFTIFYGVSNSGVILGPIISAIVVEYFNWQNLLILNELMILLWITGLVCSTWLADFKKTSIFKSMKFLGLFAVAAIIAFLYLKFQKIAEIILSIAAIGYLTFVGMLMRKNPLQRKALLGAIGLIICAIVFFTGEFQVASTLVAYAGQFVNLHLFVFYVPPGSLLSLESIAVVIGAFLISKTDSFTKATPLQFKILIGLGCGIVSFLILYGSTLMANHHIISLWWIITFFVLLGVGEVSMTPSIFAYIAHIAPSNFKGMLMAGAYFALSLSGYFSTFIGETLLKKFDMNSTSLSVYRANFIVTIGLLLMLAILILLQWLITGNIARGKSQ